MCQEVIQPIFGSMHKKLLRQNFSFSCCWLTQSFRGILLALPPKSGSAVQVGHRIFLSYFGCDWWQIENYYQSFFPQVSTTSAIFYICIYAWSVGPRMRKLISLLIWHPSLIWTIVAVTELSAILNSANYNNWKEVGYSTFPVHFINMPLADILDDMKTSDLNRILLQV